MAYVSVHPGEVVHRPRVTEWRSSDTESTVEDYLVDAALQGIIVENDAGLQGRVRSGETNILDIDVAPVNGGAYRDLAAARRATDIAARVCELY